MPKKACTECGQLIFVACKTCPACKAPCVASNKPKKTIAKSAKVTWAYKTHDRVQVCEYEDEELIGRVGAVRRKGLFSTSGRMRYLVRLDEVDGHAVEEDVWVGPEQLRPAPTENKQVEAAPAEAVPAEVVSVIYLDGTEAPSVTAPPEVAPQVAPEVAPEVPPADGDATVAFRDTLADNWLNLFLYQSVTAEDRREIQRVLAESGKAGVDAVYAAYQVVVDSGCHDQSMKLLHTHVGNYVATFGMEGLCRALPPLVPEDLPPDAAAAAPQIEEIIFEGTRYVPLTVSSRAVVTGLEQKPHLNGRAGKVTKIGSDGVAIFQMDATDHDESMRKIKIRVEHLQAISSAA